jgi:DinB superfamily
MIRPEDATMIDFDPVRQKVMTIPDLARSMTPADLAAAAAAMTDALLERIESGQDQDVVFVPSDPNANDTYAADESIVGLAWTLGHVIVHATASAEEAAFLAAELARGVPIHGRSRYEVPWETVTTVEQCRHRLRESRGMVLATLEVWPDEPHLEVTVESSAGPPRNAIARFLSGLMHSDSHLDQVADIVEQARQARPVGGIRV